MHDLENWLVEHGDKKFRAKQIFDWLYVKRVTDFDDMSNLSKGLREQLKDKFALTTLKQLFSKRLETAR